MGRPPTPLELLRSRLRLSQRALAARAGVSIDAIGAIERRSTRKPRLATWLALADALEVDVADLIEDAA